jgi:acetyl-CoA carboxylase biotin carboxyl carrier protein
MPIFNMKEILELMDHVAERGLGLLEIESAGMRLKIEGRRSEAAPHAHAESDASRLQSRPALPTAIGTATSGLASAPEASQESEDSWHIVTSPIVGTFYRAPNPETPPFVESGDRVSKGKVLCIIEAMKLMNEIESDGDGVVVRIFPQNGQPVEYGEKLFALKPS